MTEEIEAVLTRHVRPMMHSHGGDVVVTAVEGGTVRIRLVGECAACASAYYTVDELITQRLKEEIPQVQNVVLDTCDLDFYRYARDLLRQEKGESQ